LVALQTFQVVLFVYGSIGVLVSIEEGNTLQAIFRAVLNLISLKFIKGSRKMIAEASEAAKTANTINPKEINFMQSSIKNQTGKYTVLENAEALKNGTLKASDLPNIKIWKDANGKIWTLDHRRLAAFRIAELDEVPFQWATQGEIAGQMWKMTTKTNGNSIRLKIGNGNIIIVD